MVGRYVGKTFLPVPPEYVYSFLNTPNGLKKWFVRKCQMDFRTGGRLNLTFAKSDHVSARFTGITPLEVIRFEWPIDDVVPVTEVEIRLEVLGRGTMLTITDGDYEYEPTNPKRFQTVVQGWTGYMWNLRSVVIHGADLRNEWE